MRTSAALISLATFATAHPHPGYPELDDFKDFEMSTAMPYVPITETTVLRFSSKLLSLRDIDIIAVNSPVVLKTAGAPHDHEDDHEDDHDDQDEDDHNDDFDARGANVRGEERFKNYGCYCTPTMESMKSDFWVGTGEPVDQLDATCMALFKSYQCLKRDYDGCTPDSEYEWQTDTKGRATCENPVGTCAGDLCRLDLDFANEIFQNRDTWKARFHKQNGFDREKTCGVQQLINTPAKSSSDDDRSNKIQGVFKISENKVDPVQCCGEGLQRHPYHSGRLECCADGATRLMGTC